MRFPESKVIEALREKYPAGCRVKLTKMGCTGASNWDIWNS